MDVILLERIDRLGQMGDVVNVKPGFARNFLFPQKKALRANKDNKAYFESKRAELEATNLKRRDEAQVVAKKMDGIKLIIVRQAGEGGQLYGSVTARDIGDALHEEGYTVDRAQVLLNAEVKVDIEFTVARSVEEANLQTTQAAALLERAEDAEKLAGGEQAEGDTAET